MKLHKILKWNLKNFSKNFCKSIDKMKIVWYNIDNR